MTIARRTFLTVSAASAALLASQSRAAAANFVSPKIVDTHQHLWDLSKFRLPWLTPDSMLNHTMHLKEYREATEGLSIQAIYMEVDVDEKQLAEEADHILGLCDGINPTIAATIGGRPDSEGFSKYLERFRGNTKVKGVRRVLHSDATPPGYCLSEKFVAGVRELGKRGFHFDLCMRPTDLADGVKLASLCPETRFVLDHLGNGHPAAFRKIQGDKPAPHSAAEWKKQIENFAKLDNVICKVSGVIASLPKGGDASDLAPVVNHCLDAFGQDRVVFGSDWPVCLMGAPLRTWVDYLTQIIADRPAPFQEALWSGNAKKHYRLS